MAEVLTVNGLSKVLNRLFVDTFHILMIMLSGMKCHPEEFHRKSWKKAALGAS